MKICFQCGSQQNMQARFCGESFQSGYKLKLNLNAPTKTPNYIPHAVFAMIGFLGVAVFVTSTNPEHFYD